MISESQLRAMKKYQQGKTKSVTIRFFPSDMSLYRHLQMQSNKAGYIKALIRADMERAKQ